MFAACGLWGQGQSEPASGFAESGTFALDTGGCDASGSPGTGVSSGFVLNTLGFTNPSSDLNQTGFASSGGFTLDTSSGTASPAGPQQTGFADSTGFSLDTRNPDPLANTGFADSGGFSLDTGGYDGSDQSGYADSGGFPLDTTNGSGSGGSTQPTNPRSLQSPTPTFRMRSACGSRTKRMRPRPTATFVTGMFRR